MHALKIPAFLMPVTNCNAGRGVQLLTQPTGGEGFGILSSDAYMGAPRLAAQLRQALWKNTSYDGRLLGPGPLDRARRDLSIN